MSTYLRRVQGIAFSQCGIRPCELGDITPAELEIMLKAARERNERQEFLADARIARIQALVANIYRDTKKHPEPFSPKEFMPGYIGEEPPIPQKRGMTAEEFWSFAQGHNETLEKQKMRRRR